MVGRMKTVGVMVGMMVLCVVNVHAMLPMSQRTSQRVGMMAGMKAPGRVSLGATSSRGYNRDYDAVGGNRLAEQVKELALELQNDSGAARLLARARKRWSGGDELRAIIERCDERNRHMQRFEYVQQNDTSQRGSVELDWIEGRLGEYDQRLRQDREHLTDNMLASLVVYAKERSDLLNECSHELDIEDYGAMAWLGLKGAGATLLLMYFLVGP